MYESNIVKRKWNELTAEKNRLVEKIEDLTNESTTYKSRYEHLKEQTMGQRQDVAYLEKSL